MTSATLLGLEDYSRALYASLKELMREYPNCFSAQTAEIWREAAAGQS